MYNVKKLPTRVSNLLEHHCIILARMQLLHIHHKIIEYATQDFRIYITRYWIYITRFSNIHHKILNIHHKIIEYTSQDFEYTSQDFEYTSQEIEYTSQDFEYTSHDIAHTSQNIEYTSQDFRIKQCFTRHRNACACKYFLNVSPCRWQHPTCGS